MYDLNAIGLYSRNSPRALVRIALSPSLYFHPLALIVTVSRALANRTSIRPLDARALL
jgi:hypothetical protein